MAVKGTQDANDPLSAAPGVISDIPPSGREDAPGLNLGSNRVFGLMNTLNATNSLGQEVDTYIEKLKSFFNKDAIADARIVTHRLTQPTGSHVFMMGNCAIIILFQAGLTDQQNYAPQSFYGRAAARELTSRFKDARLINYLIVSPQDYDRVAQMGQYIAVSLAIASNPSFYNQDVQLLSGNEYVVDPDVMAAKAYINQINPHALQPRIDIGFIVYAKQARTQGMPSWAEDQRPIAAVGGYTEMMQRRQDHTGAIKYVPLVHITSISSGIPLPGILPLCLALAADQFISSRRWVSQFGFQRGKPNLGNLSADPQDPKKLWFANTPQERDEWIHANTLPAVLAIDVVEGQARIPTIALYGDPQNATRVYDQVQHFFSGKLLLDRTQAPFHVQAVDYIGAYGEHGGTIQDSRNIDYLNLLAAGGTQDENARFLQNYPQDPTIRARVVAEKTGGSFKSLYLNQISVLNMNLLGVLASAVQNTIQITSTGTTSRMTSTDWIAAQANASLSQNFTTTRPDVRGGFGWGQFGGFNV